jgi:hypothetical protein
MELLSRRLQVTALLSALGAVVGAVTAVALSFFATVVAQATIPVGHVEYHYGPFGFAVVAAIGTPLLSWLLMRRVPLWRAIGEPAMGGVVGTLLALSTVPLFRAPLLVQPLCVLAGIGVAALRLRHVYSNQGNLLPDTGLTGVPTHVDRAS